MKLLKMNEVFQNIEETGGIFTQLQTLAVPWQEDDIAYWLDLAYHLDRSAFKPVSPLVMATLDHADALTTSQILKLARICYTLNAIRWSREYATRSAEYNPIENYSMVEQMSNDNRTTNRDSTRTTTGESNAESNQSGTMSSDIYGFNSAEGSPDRSTANTETNTGTQTVTGTDTNRETIADTHSYRLTRSGNIGVTTSQQMLESERELWKWSFFRDVVFPDIDKCLTLAIY